MQADPHKLNEMKLVRTAAWEVLRRHFGSDGPPLGAGPSELCKDCCRVIFDDSQAKGQRSEHGARMASLLKQVPDEYEGNRYMVDKQLKQQWKRWQREGYEDASVHLYCECSEAGAATARLRPAAQRIDVSEEAMAAVRTVFPQTRFFTSDAQVCQECLGRKEQDRKAQNEQRGLRARHRDLLPRLATSPPQPLPPQLPLTLRVLPAGWLDAWAAYVDGGERPPALESGGLLTAQGLLKASRAGPSNRQPVL